MKKWLIEHSLSIVVFSLFFVFLFGQSLAGHRHYNQEQTSHQQPTATYTEYLRSGDFIEGVFENWESEFLQMGMYVVLTVFLYQKGSSESKKLSGTEPVDAQPRNSKHAAWPVRQGGLVLWLYENSLSIAFLVLFLMSFWLHAYGGSQATCQENFEHTDLECPSTIRYMGSSKFWYESFQNWQSEFLAVGSIVALSVFLRQKGSPESKPVNVSNGKTGTE